MPKNLPERRKSQGKDGISMNIILLFVGRRSEYEVFQVSQHSWESGILRVKTLILKVKGSSMAHLQVI